VPAKETPCRALKAAGTALAPGRRQLQCSPKNRWAAAKAVAPATLEAAGTASAPMQCDAGAKCTSFGRRQ
jgi:hypothetical protein